MINYCRHEPPQQKPDRTPSKSKTLTQAFCESVRHDVRDSLRAGRPEVRALQRAISSAHAAATGWRVDEALFLAEAVTENVNAHAEALEIRKMISRLESTPKQEPPAESADEEAYLRALKEAAAFSEGCLGRGFNAILVAAGCSSPQPMGWTLAIGASQFLPTARGRMERPMSGKSGYPARWSQGVEADK